MMKQFELRQATAGDCERLYRIQSQSMKPYVEQIWGWNESFQEERFRQGFDPDKTRIVLSNEREIGFLRVTEKKEVVFIEQIYITPEYQGRGIGTALVREVFSRNLPVELSVLKLNTDARRLYERLGFRVNDENATHCHMRIEPARRLQRARSRK